MRTKQAVRIAVVLAVFVVGVVAGAWASKKGLLGADLFTSKSTKDAGHAVLTAAQTMADKEGSWEKIAVARVNYLSGDKAGAQAAFDRVLADKKVKAGDWYRIGKIYLEAGEWDKAKTSFDKVLELEPKDQDWLAEIGSYYVLKGDRAKGEELFARSFTEDSDSIYNAVKVAGSYLGVKPN